MGIASESIIKQSRSCFFCGSEYGLEKHHCIHGTANRRLADADGLWVWLCPDCHRGTDGVHGKNGHEKDMALKMAAEYAWLDRNHYIDWIHKKPTEKGMQEWVSRYGKNFL